MAEESRSIIETEEEIAPGARLAEQAADLVCIEGVTKSFGYKTAVKEVSFSVPAGQICGLLGGDDDAFPAADGDSEGNRGQPEDRLGERRCCFRRLSSLLKKSEF